MFYGTVRSWFSNRLPTVFFQNSDRGEVIIATTKIWSIRDSLSRVVDYAENPDKTENPNYSGTEIQGLYDVMNYAADDHKTEMQYYVSGVNCLPEIAREQMIMTKKRYNKEGGIVAFHAYQSFKPGEVTPDKAHQIGVELANQIGRASCRERV